MPRRVPTPEQQAWIDKQTKLRPRSFKDQGLPWMVIVDWKMDIAAMGVYFVCEVYDEPVRFNRERTPVGVVEVYRSFPYKLGEVPLDPEPAPEPIDLFAQRTGQRYRDKQREREDACP